MMMPLTVASNPCAMMMMTMMMVAIMITVGPAIYAHNQFRCARRGRHRTQAQDSRQAYKKKMFHNRFGLEQLTFPVWKLFVAYSHGGCTGEVYGHAAPAKKFNIS
jgi:hypothetical protein